MQPSIKVFHHEMIVHGDGGDLVIKSDFPDYMTDSEVLSHFRNKFHVDTVGDVVDILLNVDDDSHKVCELRDGSDCSVFNQSDPLI